ncbi:MAG: glycosyltransferase family 39 protein [Chloroflexi bacterium]|nr:glycosyltransferase family 39 protein [Chloroflexota bacterium]
MHTIEYFEKSRASRLLFIAVILWATILRFYNLADQSLWYDEGFSIALAKASWAKAIAWTAQDVHPPLYYLLLHLWIRLCGDSAFAVRAFSALFGIAILPLIYLIGRHVLGEATGLVATFLATLSPLGLYYSRETRMYALATFLVLLSSDLLLRITNARCPRERRILWWATYLFTSLAAAYVHYFALPVLVAHALYFGVWWWMAGRPSAYLREAVSVLIVWALGYAPWSAVLINRYLYDTGYWAATMPFLLALYRVFTSLSVGESVLEPLSWYVTLGYIALLIVSALQFVQACRKSHTIPPLSFLWICLLIPAILIAFLYSRKPRISPRHSMLISPAFLLLISAALVQLTSTAGQFVASTSALTRFVGTSVPKRFVVGTSVPKRLVVGTSVPKQRSSKLRPISILAAFIAICFVLATSVYADYNLFCNPDLRRPDFRAAVGYIREHRAPDEAVLLISGHMFPIFDYYCPGCERYPIPNDPLLRVDHRLTLQFIDQLQPIMAGKRGAWLLLWQDYVVDPQHIVANLLLSQGTELPVPAFHGVGVRHIQLSPGAQFVWNDAVTLPAPFHWQGGITLREARVNSLAFHHGETMQLTLYWSTDSPIKESYTIFAHVAQGETHTQHDGIPANETRPTNTWRPGEIIEDRHIIEIPSWLPPGEYELQLGFYRHTPEGLPRLPVVDEAGQVIGSEIILGAVRILADGQ